eukprot:GHVT01078779.1.p1 GENE.GHVT01078779.1~~GHVT01078779.1.p1  ORF type:complete len:242 (-),score=27.16 GHVT01078779.1:745-1470(-)
MRSFSIHYVNSSLGMQKMDRLCSSTFFGDTRRPPEATTRRPSVHTPCKNWSWRSASWGIACLSKRRSYLLVTFVTPFVLIKRPIYHSYLLPTAFYLSPFLYPAPPSCCSHLSPPPCLSPLPADPTWDQWAVGRRVVVASPNYIGGTQYVAACLYALLGAVFIVAALLLNERSATKQHLVTDFEAALRRSETIFPLRQGHTTDFRFVTLRRRTICVQSTSDVAIRPCSSGSLYASSKPEELL